MKASYAAALKYSFNRSPRLGTFLGVPLATIAFAQTPSSPGNAVREEDDTVLLSPFVIATERDSGWIASNTLVGTRTNEELVNLPISVDAITADFIRDLDAKILDDAASWVAGINVTPALDSRSEEGRIFYRGMSAAGEAGQSQRNFFNWYPLTDNYNIERIDFNKGANSLMFGDMSPGGQATTYTKIPRFKNFGSVTAQYGSYDSHRFELDVNRKLTEKVAVRMNAVQRSTRREIHFVDSSFRAIDAAMMYRPFKHTTVRAEFEAGEFRWNRGDNQLTLQTLSAPGRGFNTIGTRAFYTSDGEVVLRSPNTGTIVFPSAGDRIAGGGDTLSLLHGQSQTVILRTLNANGTGAVDTDRTLTLNGFDRNLNWHGVAEYQNRHYTAATIWVAHSVGKLNLEASYNQQIQDQFRNDTPFSNILRVDGVGRPYVDLDNTQFKEIGNKVRIPRFTATYPLEFGKWSKQYVVATATFLRDHFHIFRWSPANVAVNDNSPNPVPLANNRISFRAYLDSPEALGRGFWEQFRIENLPEQPGFRVGWNTFTDAVNPFWTARYQKTYSISSSGQYLGGKLRTLIGARFDSFDLKKTDKWTKDEFGNDIDPGGPDVAPEAFAFDPNYDLTHWTLNGGVVYTLTPNVNVYGNYSESYRWQGTQDFLGNLLGPVLGYTKEIGAKGNLFGNMLMYSLAAYQTDRDNASFLWSPTNVTQVQLEDLINPNNVLPSDPAYLTVPVGIRQEHRTTTATEKSRGVETTLQLRRVAGFQARVTFSYNKITSDREFGRFKELYDVAAARTAAALAPGGDPAMAEDATLLGRMKVILDQNLGVLHVTGLRSRPYNANWLVDYEFQRESRLRGTRIGLGGQWGSSYAIDEVGGTVFHDDAAHPISAYIIHRRDLFGHRTTFRGGVTNLYDLENGNSEWRHTGVARVLSDGTPVYDYRYTALPQWTLTMTVDF